VADEASYVRQVSQHAAAVLRVATALVGHDDAEDAVQEALTRAWRAWGTLRDTNRGALLAVAHHCQRLP
jgi:DNA-directed RNA polymerase specialized sigma24 family protein